MVSAREGLRLWLVKETGGCDITVDADNKDWPCGTCVIDLLQRLGLNRDDPAYSIANEPRDRLNEVWRAIMQIRANTK